MLLVLSNISSGFITKLFLGTWISNYTSHNIIGCYYISIPNTPSSCWHALKYLLHNKTQPLSCLSNYMPQYTVGFNYLSMPQMPNFRPHVGPPAWGPSPHHHHKDLCPQCHTTKHSGHQKSQQGQLTTINRSSLPCFITGLILGFCSANERWCYFVMTSLIGWAQT